MVRADVACLLVTRPLHRARGASSKLMGDGSDPGHHSRTEAIVKPPLRALAVLALLFSMDAEVGEAGGKRQIPVVVRGEVKPAVVEAGKPIRLTVTVTNGLGGSIRFPTYRLGPTDWNGETVNVSLVDIYRDGQRRGLFLKRPAVRPPIKIAGMASYEIKPKQSLVVRTDARKWTLRDAWLPGRYKVTVRIDRLTLDHYAVLSVTSDPFVFEIKAAATRAGD